MAFFALLRNSLIRTTGAVLFLFFSAFLSVTSGKVTNPEIEKLIQLGRAEADIVLGGKDPLEIWGELRATVSSILEEASQR